MSRSLRLFRQLRSLRYVSCVAYVACVALAGNPALLGHSHRSIYKYHSLTAETSCPFVTNVCGCDCCAPLNIQCPNWVGISGPGLLSLFNLQWLVRLFYMASKTDCCSEVVVIRGIPVETVDCKVDAKLLCTACKLLPRNPYQGLCGHRFCSSCITDQLSRFVSWLTSLLLLDLAWALM